MPREHQQARGALSPLSIKFFAYFQDHKQSCPWRESFPHPRLAPKGKKGRSAVPSARPLFPGHKLVEVMEASFGSPLVLGRHRHRMRLASFVSDRGDQNPTALSASAMAKARLPMRLPRAPLTVKRGQSANIKVRRGVAL
jgi:hypothetical protein